MPSFHPSTLEAIQSLRQRFPSAPFLTLGQTVLWDEPVKAAFCRILEQCAPDAATVAAVHDTDYFAKLAPFDNREEKFVIVPHNDGDTRGLWSAAGELSCLFGSETVPTRATLTENGVAVDRVARNFPGGLEALLNQETDAWGWRALVHTEPHPLIAADVKLRDIAPALRRQLEWGLGQSVQFLAEPEAGQKLTAQMLAWVEEYISVQPDGTLSGLYQWLTPKLWVLMRGGQSCNLQTGASMELFRFNPQTCKLPRFAFVELFLQPATREIAKKCYNEALRGSGIYELSQFGPGALPFDVVIPGHGRGTLRLHESSLFIQTEEPITLCTGCDCGSIEDLADALQNKFGPEVALVGKAVSLISMLAAEFVFVFHERASSYTARTQKMNQCLREAGISLALHPMLRLKYATWDALKTTPATFRLPTHLATAFSAPTISATEFAARWEAVCDEQDRLRGALKSCQAPRDLLNLLADWKGAFWIEKLEEYREGRGVIKTLREQTQVLEAEVLRLRQNARANLEAAATLERQKGEDFRATVQPLRERLFDLKEAMANRLVAVGPDGKPVKLSREEKAAQASRELQEENEIESLREKIETRQAERAHFDEQISKLRGQARNEQAEAKSHIAERVALERSAEAVEARATIARIEAEAELARLRFVRDAIAVSAGLRYTNFRPTAWWFPLVSPGGEWFDELARTAQARLEEL